MYGDKRNRGDYDNGVWMSLLGDIPFIEDERELEPYDVVINTLWMESTVSGRTRRIKQRWPHKIVIGLSDHPLSTHISKMPANQQAAYIQDLEFLDGLMALTEEERQWYQAAVPRIPVIKAGLPFPFEEYGKRYGELRNNTEKPYIGLGVGAADNDRNFISSALVFDRIHDNHEDLNGVYLSLPSYQIAETSVYADYFGGIFLHERVDMKEFYTVLSQCKFVINLADRNTPGRIQGEGAYFGVPVIGSNRLELQNELFPKLAVSPYSVEDAVMKAEWLLANPDETEKLVANARTQLQAYNYRRSRSKFNKLLQAILEKTTVQGV